MRALSLGRTVSTPESDARTNPSVFRSIWNDPKGRAGIVLSAAIVATLLFGPVGLGTDPLDQSLRERLLPPLSTTPQGVHLLGTDQFGRDVLSRILSGGQMSVMIGLTSSLFASVLGVAAGLAAGFFGPRWDAPLMILADIQLTFPSIMFALAVMVVLGPGVVNLVAVLAISSWVFQARIVRGEVLALKSREFIEAGRAIGATETYLLVRYVFPNVLGAVLVLFTLTFVRTVLSEASLSFLGLGIQPPAPSWGGMLSEGRQYLASAWWTGTFPGLALMLSVIAVNLVGDSLRDAADPRIQQEAR